MTNINQIGSSRYRVMIECDDPLPHQQLRLEQKLHFPDAGH